MGGSLLDAIDPPPDAFAIVMATGIASVAAGDHHYRWISLVLAILGLALLVAIGAGVLLVAATRPMRVVRLARDPDALLRMFTVVAACAVLAGRWRQQTWLIWVFAALALAAWLVLTPVGAFVVLSRPRAELRANARGAWLLPSVATSGLAIVATDLAERTRAAWLVVAAGIAVLLALVLYAAMLWLIAGRALTTPLGPAAVTPDAWILMGALAISALARASVHRAALAVGASGLATAAGPAAAALWILASAWIPALAYAALWRVDHLPGSLSYDSSWWSAVFPLGMYSTASAAVASQLGMHPLVTISLVFFWVALAVWTAVAVGLLRAAVVRRRRGFAATPPDSLREWDHAR